MDIKALDKEFVANTKVKVKRYFIDLGHSFEYFVDMLFN